MIDRREFIVKGTAGVLGAIAVSAAKFSCGKVDRKRRKDARLRKGLQVRGSYYWKKIAYPGEEVRVGNEQPGWGWVPVGQLPELEGGGIVWVLRPRGGS